MADSTYLFRPRQNSGGTYTSTSTGEVTHVTANTGGVPTPGIRTYGPRNSYLGDDGTIKYYENQTSVPLSVVEIHFLKTGVDIRNTPDQFINVTYRPPYFVLAAQSYQGKDKEERKAFVIDQLKKLEQSFRQYQEAASLLQKEAAEYDGQSDISKWAIAAGTVAIATANPYAVAGGAIVSAMGALLQWVKKKSDTEKLEPLQYKAQLIQTEATVIAQYHEQYSKELKGSPLVALMLAGGLFYLAESGA